MNSRQFGDAHEQTGCLQSLLREVATALDDIQVDRMAARRS
jgi:hypothetical protein